MKYSVVIPSLYEHDGEYLHLCVKSLRDSGFDGEIIVVTNGTKTPRIIDLTGITKRLHTSDQGQCTATNIGVQAATADWVMVSNSDMYYAPGWDKHLRFEDNTPVFSPNLVEPTNNAGSAPPFLKYDGGLTLEEFKKEDVDWFIHNTLNSRPLVQSRQGEPGFNLPFFMKKRLWNFLGGYDTNFDPWGSNSDTDLQTRINLAGVQPWRWRDVLVYHFSNKTPTFAPENDAFRLNNFEYFKQKHGFDRDELGSDVWMNKDMIPEDKSRIKYEQAKYEQ